MNSPAGALLRRPDLWPSALAFVPRRWYRQWPPLPLPSRSYLRFRTEAMYGTDGRLSGEDLVRYLEWVKNMRTMKRRAR